MGNIGFDQQLSSLASSTSLIIVSYQCANSKIKNAFPQLATAASGNDNSRAREAAKY